MPNPELPRDRHRDLPDDVRHGRGYPTFHELDEVLDDRDREHQYEARFRAIEKRQGQSVLFLVVLGIIAFALVVGLLVVFLSGSVR